MTRPAPWRPYATVFLLTALAAWQCHVVGIAASADASALIEHGARKATRGFPQAPWRLLASTFLHAGWWHLLTNLMVIGFWGARVERLLGRGELLALFLLSGFWGSLLSDIYGPSMVAVGASGAAFAMLSAVLMLAVGAPNWSSWQGQSRQWLTVSLAALLLNVVGGWGLASRLQGAALDHWAHAGGALCGALLAAGCVGLGEARRRVAFWGLALLLSLLAAGIVSSRGPTLFG